MDPPFIANRANILRSHKWRAIGAVAILVVPLLLVAFIVFTGGGVVVINSERYVPTVRSRLPDSNPIRIHFHGTWTTSLVVPAIVEVQHYGPPYDLAIQAWDDNDIYSSIRLREITIETKGGRKTSVLQNHTMDFKRHESVNSGPEGIVRRSTNGALEKFPDKIDGPVEGILKATGEVLMKKGGTIPFEIEYEFVPFKRTDVQTNWAAIANI
jgi:hypothetical protein